MSAYPRRLLGTGPCAALTTFSTMRVELRHMLDRGHLTLAAISTAAGVAAGFVAAWLASAIARRGRALR